MMTIEDIERTISGTFGMAWISEIHDEKPDVDATRAEVEQWTAAAKAKFVAAIDNLSRKAIEEYGT